MSNLERHRTTKSACLGASKSQPAMPDGSLMVHVNDPVDAIHSARQPEQAFDRHREAVMLDRLFWFTVGMLMVVGIAIRIWVLL